MIDANFANTMAAYNRWQNMSLYNAADGLSAEERCVERGAFFGSIESTLNHVLWGDRIWLSRFAGAAKPNVDSIQDSPNECADWEALKSARLETDQQIVAWAGTLTTEALQQDLTWFSGAAGKELSMPLGLLVVHFFNHQTHHRGQVHAMLTAAGAAPDDTDLFIMPDEWRETA